MKLFKNFNSSLFLLLISSIFLSSATFTSPTALQAQVVPDSIYYKRLYYVGKVWGFLKYFHSEVAKGLDDWDATLLNTLTLVKYDSSHTDFNNSLLEMLKDAGKMAEPTSPLPIVPDSLRYNLNLDWITSPIFSETVQLKLDTVKKYFRPQVNFYVKAVSGAGNPSFETDTQYHQWGRNLFPGENKRLLALFRYWNIINYFYPYKNIIDQDWDTTLVEFIPKILHTQNQTEFHLTFLELATRINDSHAYTYSSVINESIVGYHFLPWVLKYIENQTVIVKELRDNAQVEAGDVIKSINHIPIHSLRDSLRKYTQGSNNATIERNINLRILRGPYETLQMVLENDTGEKEITVPRQIWITEYYSLRKKKRLYLENDRWSARSMWLRGYGGTHRGSD